MADPQNPTPDFIPAEGAAKAPDFIPAEGAQNAAPASPQDPGYLNAEQRMLAPGSTIGDVVQGAGGEMLRHGAGVLNLASHLVPGVTGTKEEPLRGPAEPENPSLAYRGGELLENVGEFAAGGEALKGVTALAKLAKVSPELFKFIEAYPRASKVLSDIIVGGQQGAVAAAGKGQSALKGAAEGAAGAGAGGAIAEGAGPALKKGAQTFGLGGLDAITAMSKAGRAAVGEQHWEQSIERAMPAILDELEIGTSKVKAGAGSALRSIKKVGDFVDVLDNARNRLWTQNIAPQVARNANLPIDAKKIGQAVRLEADPAWQELTTVFGRNSKINEAVAEDFDNLKNIGLKRADNILGALNAELKRYYRMTPEQQAAAGIVSGEINSLESASRALRDQIYTTLEKAGEQTPREFRQQYGALTDMSRVFEKRASVDIRQQPLNLAQQITGAGGVGGVVLGLLRGLSGDVSGFGEAGASMVPFAASTAARVRQSSPSLIRQGLSAARREAEGPGAVEQVATRAAKEAIPAAGRRLTDQAEQAPEASASTPESMLPEPAAGHVRFQSSDGRIHDIPRENLAEAKRIDPKLMVLSE